MQLKLLNRIATVKGDGTVEFEVPVDVEPQVLGVRSNEATVAATEPIDVPDVEYRPPLQIVMLIVGTRGDVQPFVAIGKRLQVMWIWLFLYKNGNNASFAHVMHVSFYFSVKQIS